MDNWTSYTKTTDTDGVIVETTVTMDNNDGTRVVKTTDGGESVTETRSITVNKASFTFTKDGTWEIELNTTTTWTEAGGGWIVEEYTYTVVETMKQSGTWSFIGGESEEFENKERIIMSVKMSEGTNQTTTETLYRDGSTDTSTGNLFGNEEEYASGENTAVYSIDMLKGKEMVLKQDKTGESSTSNTDGAITFTFTVTQEGEVEIRLVE
ncbi:MAG: hypothetical protein ACPG21_07365 [Crocinitomicaceae bacterium]